MNFIREKISGKKKRLKQNEYNLDLTYITNRIIAMSYPASGLESIYRNHINDVAKFLGEQHSINYLVINLSGRQYDYCKFNKMVLEFNWEDHHAPQLSIIFQICDMIHKFLLKNILNVVVIHCLAGKGRTGTAICCYLMYCGRFRNSYDALQYYAMKRFKVLGLGVTQPCQIRYVQYFEEIFNKPKIYPQIKLIKNIQMYPIPSFNGKERCKPNIKIKTALQNNEIKGKKDDLLIYKGNYENFIENGVLNIIVDKHVVLCGDIIIQFYNKNYYYKTNMFRLAFNVGFIKENKIVFLKSELDPNQTLFDSRIDDQFKLIVNFENECKCTTKTKFIKQCETCSIYLQKENINWELIQVFFQYLKEILFQYEQPTPQISSILLFGNEDLDDINFLLEKEKSIDKKTSSSDLMNIIHQMFDDDQLDKLQKTKQKTLNELEKKQKLNTDIQSRKNNKTTDGINISQFQF